jgi:hypothetical protein
VFAVSLAMGLGVWGCWTASGGRALFVSGETRWLNERS